MIFCVEDDRNIRELLVYTLESTGFQATGFENAKTFRKALAKELPELVLLDVMLPGEDGYSVLRWLKTDERWRDIPVIMVTAKGEEYDKVVGLDAGADDYITKPFGMMELISRIRAVLRRLTRRAEKEELLRIGNLEVDRKKHEVRLEGEEITLTLKEYQLLVHLMRQSDTVHTREQLLESVWGYGFSGETRTLDVHIRTLRQKLLGAGGMIETVRGVGYRINSRKQTES